MADQQADSSAEPAPASGPAFISGQPGKAKKGFLGWVIANTALNSAFGSLTFGGSIFVLFLDYLGLTKADIGLVLALFPFCGLLALVVGPISARVGYKKTYLIFYGLRKPVLLLLLAAPMVSRQYGHAAVATYVSGVMLTFAIFRAIAETGYFPWYCEFVPASIRGRFSAVSNLVSVSTIALTVWLASYALARSEGATGFLTLICVGVGLGLLSVAMMLPVPGGHRVKGSLPLGHYLGGLRQGLSDRRFIWFLLGVGLYVVGMSGNSFVMLYMRDLVGLQPAQVVRLEPISMVGGMTSGFLAGWASDRYGGRPVVLVGVIGILALPILWLLMPHHSPASLYLAYAGAFWGGVFGTTVGISTTRLLFSELIPADRSMNYTSINYAATGLFGAMGPLLWGNLLTHFKDFGGNVLGLSTNQYTPQLVSVFVLVALAGTCFARVTVRRPAAAA